MHQTSAGIFKAEEAAMGNLPDSGTVLISVKDQDKNTPDVAKVCYYGL